MPAGWTAGMSSPRAGPAMGLELPPVPGRTGTASARLVHSAAILTLTSTMCAALECGGSSGFRTP